MNIGIYHEQAGMRHAGGIAVFVQEIGAALAEHHTVYLYTGSGELTETVEASPLEVVQVPEFASQRRVSTAAERWTPLGPQHVDKLLTFANGLKSGVLGHMNRHLDVLYTHQFVDDLLWTHLVDAPVVYEYHGLQSTGAGSTARELLSATDWVVANSRYTAASIRDAFDRSVDAVVPPGVDCDVFTPDARPAFDDERPSILFVGRLVGGKGIFDLVDAVSEMKAEPRVTIVGRGAKERLHDHARSRGVASNLQFAGVVAHDKLARYYSACDVFCNPTHYESYGMVNLEAMACGAPLVTTTVGGIPEYATHEETARLVPPEDPDALARELDDLLRSTSSRDRLGTNAHDAAAERTWATRAETFERFCERSISPR